MDFSAYYNAIESNTVYDDSQKRVMNDILFEIQNDYLSDTRRQDFMSELDDILYNLEKNKRENFTNESDFLRTKGQIDARLFKLLRTIRDENKLINPELYLAQRVLEDFFKGRKVEFRIYDYTDDEIIQMYHELVDTGTLKVYRSGGQRTNDVTQESDSSKKGRKSLSATYELIEVAISEYNAKTEEIKKDIAQILVKLAYSDEYKNVTSLITKLDAEFIKLRTLANELIEAIGKYRDNNFGKDNFSLKPSQIQEKVKEFRKRLREIKQTQKDHYDANVRNLNNRISNLKKNISTLELSDEDKEIIINLTLMEESKGSFYQPGKIGYLTSIKYDELLELTKIVESFEKKIKIDKTTNLETNIKSIQNKIKDIDSNIKDKMIQDEINELIEKYGVVSCLIIVFNENLNANKEKISKEEFNKYVDYINKAKNDLNQLRKKLGSVNVIGKEKVNNDFEGLMRELNILNAHIDRFMLMLRPNTILEVEVSSLKGDLKKFEDSLADIVNRIQVKYNEEKIDVNQFNALLNHINITEKNIKSAHFRINDPLYAKNFDIFDRISGLKKRITSFEKVINEKDKPISDKSFRRQVDMEITCLEAEIKTLYLAAKTLEQNEPDKYEEVMKEIFEQEDILNKINGEYRRKCPLLVKNIKSTKNLFKKHKKGVLIASGLASLAIIHATFGPILGPAIMQGNIMLMNKVPAFRPILKGVNKIVAGWIGAKPVIIDGHSAWQIKNSSIINSSCISSSLLRGIALSVGATSLGFGSFTAGLVLTVKGITEKIKKNELRNKFESYKENQEKKRKEEYKRLKEILIKFNSAKIPFDDFVEQFNLNEKEKKILKVYNSRRPGGRK